MIVFYIHSSICQSFSALVKKTRALALIQKNALVVDKHRSFLSLALISELLSTVRAQIKLSHAHQSSAAEMLHQDMKHVVNGEFFSGRIKTKSDYRLNTCMELENFGIFSYLFSLIFIHTKSGFCFDEVTQASKS